MCLKGHYREGKKRIHRMKTIYWMEDLHLEYLKNYDNLLIKDKLPNYKMSIGYEYTFSQRRYT